MAETFLTLTNKVLVKLNEVELTSADFSNTRGVQTQAKNAVNESIRYINQREFNFPFNHVAHSQKTVPGIGRYSLPTDAKTVDYNTFRISSHGHLSILTYNEFIENHSAAEDDVVTSTIPNNTSDISTSATDIPLVSATGFAASGSVFIGPDTITYTSIDSNVLKGCSERTQLITANTIVAQFDQGNLPTHIVRTPANEFLLHPYPHKEYTVKFDYYSFPTELVNHGDTTTIPDRFASVIVDGATSFLYQYRGEVQQYGVVFARYEQGIKNMQTLLANRFDYVRSGYIPNMHSSRNASFERLT